MTENKKNRNRDKRNSKLRQSRRCCYMFVFFYHNFLLCVCYFTLGVTVMYKNTLTLKKTHIYGCYFSYDYQDKRRLVL